MSKSRLSSGTLSKHVCLTCGREEVSTDQELMCPTDQSVMIAEIEDPWIGKVLNETYLITKLIGSGSWARVYRAQHLNLGKQFALKIAHSHVIEDPEKLKRFEREARTLSSLNHPNLVRVVDFGMEPQPFVAMEYISGKSLEQVIRVVGPFPVKIALSISKQLCAAMTTAHAAGVIHRDLKPSNVIVSGLETGNPIAKVLDFGIAKILEDNEGSDLTKTGEIIGSPHYLSPEQIGGQPVDERSDIYSLGCVMYEMLSGEKAFESGSILEIMHRHLYETPKSLVGIHPGQKVSPALDKIIQKCLAKRAPDRFQTMQALAAALKDVPASLQVSSTDQDALSALPPLPPVWPGIAITAVTGACSVGVLLQWLNHSGSGLSFLNAAAILGALAFCFWQFFYFRLRTFAQAIGYSPKYGTKQSFAILLLSSTPFLAVIAFACQLLHKVLLGSGKLEFLLPLIAIFTTANAAFVFSLFSDLSAFISSVVSPGKLTRTILLPALLTASVLLPALYVTVFAGTINPSMEMLLTIVMSWLLSFIFLGYYKLELLSCVPGTINVDISALKTQRYLTVGSVLVMCGLSSILLMVPDDYTVQGLSRRILQNPHDGKAYSDRGAMLLNQDKFLDAMADFSKAVELDPSLVYAWRSRAKCENELGLYDKALEDSSQAIDLDPSVYQTYIARGIAHFRLGHHQEAIADLTYAAEHNPKNENDNCALAYLWRSKVHSALGNKIESEADRTRAAQLHAKHKNWSPQHNYLEKELKR